MSKHHTPAVARDATAPETTAGDLLENLLANARPAPDARTNPAVPAHPATEAVLGHLAGIDADGRVLFRPEGSDVAVPVAIALEIGDGTLVKAARNGRAAMALRTTDSQPRWVLTGLVRERVAAKARAAGPGELEVKVDGETVRIEAQRSIELSCGKSSLVLRADGRVVLSGVYVVTKSNGPLKIKGATIALN